MPLKGQLCPTRGVPVAWQRRCISFSMTARDADERALEQLRDAADRSFHTWLDVRCNGRPLGLDVRQTLALAECSVSEYNPSAPNTNAIIFVKDWRAHKFDASAFGVTMVRSDSVTGEIYDADINLNETLGELAICARQCAPGQVDFENVLTHEAGHFLGLSHSTDLEATMAARATVGETKKRDLDDDDREGLCSIYGALSQGATQLRVERL